MNLAKKDMNRTRDVGSRYYSCDNSTVHQSRTVRTAERLSQNNKNLTVRNVTLRTTGPRQMATITPMRLKVVCSVPHMPPKSCASMMLVSVEKRAIILGIEHRTTA